ncbi:MAG: HlyC/CorC family transporter [Deltaproteobacteria bacterium]|nr:HlyC/CorC family transporter [Deltaproteobacteria bacterium]
MLEILIIFLLLIVNGIFAMAEIAVVSARKARLQQQAMEGSRKAKAALDLATNPNQFLSTVQIGITLVGILAGAFGGATIASELGTYFKGFPPLAPYGDALGVGVVVVLITYFSLILGELVPKRLALNHAERIAASMALPMQALAVAVSPFVRILSLSTDVVIRLLRIRPSTEPPVTDGEIKAMLAQGTRVGVFEEAEQGMIEGVLRLGDRLAGELLTPRTQIVWIDPNDSWEDVQREIISSRHSRFPLAEGDLDRVLGILNVKDILVRSLRSEPIDLREMLTQPLLVPESMPALQVLDLFKQKGSDLAMVVDEYGGVQGLITHNDILEDIVGYVPLPAGLEEPSAVRREDGSFLVDGLLPVDKLKEILGIDKLPDEEEGHYQTLGGFVITRFGRIPSVGQWLEWRDFVFEVVDMDWRRVDKVLIKRIQDRAALPEEADWP